MIPSKASDLGRQLQLGSPLEGHIYRSQFLRWQEQSLCHWTRMKQMKELGHKPISHPAYFATKSIHLMHQLRFCRATHGWITRLLNRNKPPETQWQSGYPRKCRRIADNMNTSNEIHTTNDYRKSKERQKATCQAMRSKFIVNKRVWAPIRAAASAASQPAWPPPTTTTSNLSSWTLPPGTYNRTQWLNIYS